MTQFPPPEGGYPPPPQYGAPQYAAPQYGTPQYGTPQYGTPQYGTPQYGTPQYGTPQYGTPQYGYGAPGYGSPAGPPGAKPSTNIGWAIAAIFTFWPLAIPAFIYSSRVDDSWNRGDAAGAHEASRKTRTFGLVAVVIGAVLAVLAILLFIAIGALFTATTHEIVTNFTPEPFPT